MTGVALLDRSHETASQQNHPMNRGFALHPSLKSAMAVNKTG
jgi:hypothetical protein